MLCIRDHAELRRRIPWLNNGYFLVTLFLALYPLLLLSQFLGYVVLAWLSLGRWPRFNDPDPKLLIWWGDALGLRFALALFPAVCLLAIVMAIAGRLRSRAFPLWRIAGIALATTAALIVFARVDPGGFLNWFWD